MIAMDWISKWKFKKNVLVICFFAAYLIPPIYILLNKNYFAYENAWDEKTYLSYQGAMTTAYLPGYGSSIFTLLFHYIGISAAYQNLFWDTSVPILIFFISGKIFGHFKISSNWSRFYSIVLIFGSVLFNRTNPILNYLSYLKLPHFILIIFQLITFIWSK